MTHTREYTPINGNGNGNNYNNTDYYSDDKKVFFLTLKSKIVFFYFKNEYKFIFKLS